MAIALSCPACDRTLKVKDELAGRKIKCPHCGEVIAVLEKKADSDARITAKKPQPTRAAEDEDEEEDERPKKKKKKKAKSNRGLLIGAGIGGAAIIAIVVFVTLNLGDNAKPKVAQAKKESPPVEAQPAGRQPVVEDVPEKKAPAGAAARIREVTVVQNALRQLGIAYKNFEALENRGPKNQKELSPYYENSGEINEALTKKWLTFIWGAPRQSLTEHGDSNTILAYETDADRQGIRMVLFGDGSVRGLDENEFQSAPKAKAKGK